MALDLSQIYTQVITEHSNSNRNKHHLEHPDVVEEGVNPSCGDEITLEVRIENGIIEEASFTGSGCAISQASTSIMVDLMEGKTIEEARVLVETFLGMVKKEITDEDELEALEEAIALQNISNMPARVKCAVLAWYTLKKALDEYEQKSAEDAIAS